MPTTYIPAPPSVVAMTDTLLASNYPEMREAGVTLLLQMAHAARNEKTGEPKGAALWHGGYPAAALVKVTPLKDRVAGLPDARIVLDGDGWDERPEPQQRAILDHELMHLELVVDDDGHVQADDVGRPKLKLRKHDWQQGGFNAIAERHREHSLEALHADDMVKLWKQLDLPWG